MIASIVIGPPLLQPAEVCCNKDYKNDVHKDGQHSGVLSNKHAKKGFSCKQKHGSKQDDVDVLVRSVGG